MDLDKPWIRLLQALGLAFGLILQAAPASAQDIEEYRIKAAFLYNFAKFVDWPSTAFTDAKDPIKICVLGQNPFGDSLQNIIRGKEIGERPLASAQVTDSRQATACQVIFVPASEWKRYKKMAIELTHCTALIVGETEDFLSAGGEINFMVEEGKIRFEINRVAAERAKLRISSKLLSLARSVR